MVNKNVPRNIGHRCCVLEFHMWMVVQLLTFFFYIKKYGTFEIRGKNQKKNFIENFLTELHFQTLCWFYLLLFLVNYV